MCKYLSDSTVDMYVTPQAHAVFGEIHLHPGVCYKYILKLII